MLNILSKTDGNSRKLGIKWDRNAHKSSSGEHILALLRCLSSNHSVPHFDARQHRMNTGRTTLTGLHERSPWAALSMTFMTLMNIPHLRRAVRAPSCTSPFGCRTRLLYGHLPAFYPINGQFSHLSIDGRNEDLRTWRQLSAHRDARGIPPTVSELLEPHRVLPSHHQRVLRA